MKKFPHSNMKKEGKRIKQDNEVKTKKKGSIKKNTASVKRENKKQSDEKKESVKKTSIKARNEYKAKRSFSKNKEQKVKETKKEQKNFHQEKVSVKKSTLTDSKTKNKSTNKPRKSTDNNGMIRLNRYIANAGICSRRKADELIIAGAITVNNVAITELGHKVNPNDKVRYNGTLLKREEMIYVLLNKPKDYITTTDDPQERRTVMELVKNATKERIYPVGRLDRNTTGLLLLTNDGDLAQKLTHPKNNVRKIYEVTLDKNLKKGDFEKIMQGVQLEDGVAIVDDLAYVDGKSKKVIGIEIHIGRNRIIRRLFESLGYYVEKLDRVIYANLTKKDLARGKWRHLKNEEVIQLKHLTKYLN